MIYIVTLHDILQHSLKIKITKKKSLQYILMRLIARAPSKKQKGYHLLTRSMIK